MEIPETQVTPVEAGAVLEAQAEQQGFLGRIKEAIRDRSLTEVKEALGFLALRQTSNALWVGGALGGLYAEHRFGVSSALVAPVVAASVGGIEYAGSGFAQRNLYKDAEPVNSEAANRSRYVKEASALGFAAWNGAMSTVKLNQTLELPSTPKRRAVQSGVYGAFVGLWSSPPPVFKQLGDGLAKGGDIAIQHPAEAVLTGAAGSLAWYGGLRGIQAVRSIRARKAATNTAEKTVSESL